MIEVVGWLLYAIPMLAIVLAPDAVRPRVRATVAGAAVVAAPVVLLVGTLGGEQGDRARRSPAAAPAGGRSTSRSPTRAASPATLKLASGPTTFVVTNKDASRATEYEVVQGSRTLAEVENVADGLTQALLAHAAAGPLHAALHRRRARGRLADGDRRARRRRARARRCSAASTATAPSSSARPPRW